MFNTDKLKEVLITELKLLSFRNVKINMNELGTYYIFFAIVMAWLAGIGRYWDSPRADTWQYLGLGSVIYIFILAFLIWIIIKPLKPENWSYKNVLVFVGLTSPTGFFYAIPVERYFSLDTSQKINVWFLLLVAVWRVILFFLYLKRVAKLKSSTIFVAVFLPLTLIVTALTMLNLEHVVFKIMAGLSENERSSNDAAYGVLMLITTFSIMVSPILLLIYSYIIYKNHTAKKEIG